MNLRVSFKHPVGFIPEKLYYYRVGSSAPKNKDASDYRYEVSQSHLKCILIHCPKMSPIASSKKILQK